MAEAACCKKAAKCEGNEYFGESPNPANGNITYLKSISLITKLTCSQLKAILRFYLNARTVPLDDTRLQRTREHLFVICSIHFWCTFCSICTCIVSTIIQLPIGSSQNAQTREAPRWRPATIDSWRQRSFGAKPGKLAVVTQSPLLRKAIVEKNMEQVLWVAAGDDGYPL